MPQGVRADKPARIEAEVVGTAPDGRELIQYTLTHENGLQARFLNYGATLTALVLPDGTNVVARLPRPEDYLANPAFLGSAIGPIANRIENGVFEVGGETFRIAPNEGRNVLHGGAQGYHTGFWDGVIDSDEAGPFLRLSLFSENSAHGYPSDSWAHVEVRLSDSTLRLELSAQVTRDSHVNMTVHPYFNPTGDFGTPVDGLTLWSEGVPIMVDDEGLPRPNMQPDRTLYLTDHARIGARRIDNHYDVRASRPHEDPTLPKLLATLTDHERYIYVHSDAPGLQVFTADTLTDVPGISPRGAVALEPQSLPNHFPDHAVVTHREPFRRTIAYRLAGPGLPELRW